MILGELVGYKILTFLKEVCIIKIGNRETTNVVASFKYVKTHRNGAIVYRCVFYWLFLFSNNYN